VIAENEYPYPISAYNSENDIEIALKTCRYNTYVSYRD
jgi:hypothetical protein